MRLVAIADTHLFQDDLGELPPGDVFIHAGDFCRGGTLSEFRQVVPWLKSLRFEHKILVAGNHDRCFEENLDEVLELLGPQFHYLQDTECVIDGISFWGSPWQPEFRTWAFNLPRGRSLAEKWSKIPATTDVLITHGPPLGIGDDSGMDLRCGCEALRQRVQQLPLSLHLFGHIHQDGGCWQHGDTWFANVTTWESERGPTVIDVDKITKEVMFVQVPPRKAE